MEGPVPLIKAPHKVCDQVVFIETCVIATTSKVQGKAVLFCIPLPQLAPRGVLWIKSFLTCWFSLKIMDSNG